VKIRLGDKDRARYGCEEWLDISDLPRVSNREAIAIEEDGGIPLGRWVEALRAPVSARGWNAIVWLALTRAGISVVFEDLQYDVSDLDVRYDEQPGKAEENTEPSSEPGSPPSPTSSPD
jgi:hypothetical protein